MLRTASPNISVITNFGCRSDCWYCIWKNHPLKDVCDETDWVKLENFLVSNKGKGKVSVSGGGDSLYNYGKHSCWWNKFLSLAKQFDLLVDIHTREKFFNNWFWDKINRCVFSVDSMDDDYEYLIYLSSLCKLRITHVVTKETTFNEIEKFLQFQKEVNCQFTIKELVGYDDGGMFKKIRERHPDIYYLLEGDYNIYYMPDNSIRDEFLYDGK